MIPILFESNATTFSYIDRNETKGQELVYHGIGDLLETTECVIQFNEDCTYEMELKYPITGQMVSELIPGRIIVVKSDIFRQHSIPGINYGQIMTYQAFRIYAIERNFDEIIIKCQHLSYDLNDIYSFPYYSKSGDSIVIGQVLNGYNRLQQILDLIKSRITNGTCPFTFYSDMPRPRTNIGQDNIIVPVNEPTSIRSILFNGDESVKNAWGGDWVFDNYRVRALSSSGIDTNIAIEYGQNMADVEQNEDISDRVTGILPYYLDQDKDYPDQDYRKYFIYADEILAEGTFNRENVIPVNFTQLYNEYIERGYQFPVSVSPIGEPMDGNPTFAKFNYVCELWSRDTKLGISDLGVVVKPAFLSSDIYMYDSIRIYYKSSGIDITAKVSSYTYDVLAEKCIEFEVGTAKSSALWKGIWQEGSDRKRIFMAGVSPSW